MATYSLHLNMDQSDSLNSLDESVQLEWHHHAHDKWNLVISQLSHWSRLCVQHNLNDQGQLSMNNMNTQFHNRITYSMIHIRCSNKDNLIIFMNTMGITSYMIASRAYSQHFSRFVTQPGEDGVRCSPLQSLFVTQKTGLELFWAVAGHARANTSIVTVRGMNRD